MFKFENMSEFKFVKSQRGKDSVVHDGFRYVFHRKTRLGLQYRCWRKNPPEQCGATLTIDHALRRITKHPSTHCHSSDWGSIKALESVQRMATEAHKRKNELPSVIIREEMMRVDSEAISQLPKRAALKRLVERIQAEGRPPPPTSFDCIASLPERYRMIEGKPWLIKDSADGSSSRQLIFCSSEGLRSLAMSQYWLADGTFKASPRVAYQLYAIHARLAQGEMTEVIPAAFSLMKKKTKEAYVVLFSTIRDSLPFGDGPEYISTDYELAAMQAVRTVFPNVIQAGCLFHFSQSLFRVLQKSGLQAAYNEEDGSLRSDFHRSIALAFVPEEDVLDAFDTLVEVADERLGPVLQHMHEVYVHGSRVGRKLKAPRFPPGTWNCHERTIAGLPRTTNSCEAWHSRLAKLLRKWHPNMYQFLEELMLEEADARCRRQKLELGHSPPRKVRKYVTLDIRIQRIVETYHGYKARGEVMTYLKALGLTFGGSLFVAEEMSEEEADENELPECESPQDNRKEDDEYWIAELGLRYTHRDMLLSPTEWLDDTVIDTAQKLLMVKHKHGLLSPLILAAGNYEPPPRDTDTVQIHHDGKRAHWFTTCRKGRYLRLYDSLQGQLGDEMKRQLRKYYRLKNGGLIQVEPVQQQTNSYDCGLFAIANATALVYAQNPARQVYLAKRMRQHLLNCFEERKLVPFPARKLGKRKLGKKIEL